MTRFEHSVYTVLRQVPAGTVTTYKDIAVAIGNPRAVRAVGNALHRNPYIGDIPCHRVVKSSGDLGGYVYGPRRKMALLRKEGVDVDHGKVEVERFRAILRGV